MTYVDSAVLNLTERMCCRLQTWTGRTNVWLAFQLTNLSIVVYFIWAAGLYLVSGNLALRVFVAVFCGAVFVALTRTIFKVPIETSETEAYRRVAKGLRNPRRIRDAQLRIAFLTLSVVLSYPLWLAYITLHLRFVLLTDALINAPAQRATSRLFGLSRFEINPMIGNSGSTGIFLSSSPI